MYALGIVVMQLQGNCFQQFTVTNEAFYVTQFKLKLAVKAFLKAILPRLASRTGAGRNFQ